MHTNPDDNTKNNEADAGINQDTDKKTSENGDNNRDNSKDNHRDDNNPNSAPNNNKKRKSPIALVFLILLLLAALAAIIYGLLKSYQPNPNRTPADADTNQKPHLLDKLSQQVRGENKITLQGRIEAETINLSTKLPSRVQTIYVKENQAVKAGDLLVRFISPEIEAKKQQAAAMLQSALALQSSANRGTRSENIETLYANWQSTVAQAKLAAQTYQRGEYLYKEGVISRQRRDEMLAAKQSSEQLSQAAHQQYLKAKRGRSDEQKSSADAQVQIAKAAVAEANALDSETTLAAPENGIISKIYAKPSELVMPAVPVLSMIQEHYTVSINIPEDYYSKVYQQKTLTGFIPALNKTAKFTLLSTQAEGDFASIKNTRQTGGYDIYSFKVTLEPTESIADLKTGMSVIFEIVID